MELDLEPRAPDSLVEFTLSPRADWLLGSYDSAGLAWRLQDHVGLEVVRRGCRLTFRASRTAVDLLLNIVQCALATGALGPREQGGGGMAPREQRCLLRTAQILREAIL